MKVIEKNARGRATIKTEAAFIEAFSGRLPEGDTETLLEEVSEVVRREAVKQSVLIDSSAFSNARGAWYEYILAIHLWNCLLDKHPRNESGLYNFIVRLPNVGSLKFYELFTPIQRKAIEDGLLASLTAADIEFSMSNPDFICVQLESPPSSLLKAFSPIHEVRAGIADTIINAYREIVGLVHYECFPFALSAKSSLRPDRLYQLIHEGSILKALIAHLQTRFWNSATETRFYALTQEAAAASVKTLKTAATHSVVDVFAPPVRAVDRVYEIKSTGQIEMMLQELLATTPQL